MVINMKTFFSYVRYGSPYFLYTVSLFVTTNLFGILCNSIYSAFVFISFSLLYIFLFSKSDSIYSRLSSSLSQKALSIMYVIAMLFSILLESSIITSTFHVVSDAGSGKSDLAIFALIICGLSLLCAPGGINTLKKTSNIISLLPFLIIIPCILSIVKYGFADMATVLKTSNIASDIGKGAAAFSLFASDYGYIRNAFDKSDNNLNIRRNTVATAFVFIFTIGIILSLFFGNDLYHSLTSPLFALSGITEFIQFDEILLTLISLCILYRNGCRLYFIISEFLKHYNNVRIIYPTVFALAGFFAVLGIMYINENNIMLYITVSAVLNVTSYLLLPLIIKYASSIKNKITS